MIGKEIPLGVVEAVVGISWFEITINGVANHAGTTPIEMRHDAGLSAAKIISHLREIAVSLGGNQRATSGMITFYPNAINVIPGKAVLTVDLRNNDERALQEAERRLIKFTKDLEIEDGVTIDIHTLERVPAVNFHPAIIAAIERASNNLGIPFRRMISGAGHDAQLMAGVCPSAMIFVPSKNGLSHSPLEFTPPEALENGTNVLLQTLVSLMDRAEEIPKFRDD